MVHARCGTEACELCRKRFEESRSANSCTDPVGFACLPAPFWAKLIRRHSGRDLKAPIRKTWEFMDSDHRRHWQPAVDVREPFTAALQVFVPHVAQQFRRIDLEQCEVAAAGEPGVCDRNDLAPVGAVNES